MFRVDALHEYLIFIIPGNSLARPSTCVLANLEDCRSLEARQFNLANAILVRNLDNKARRVDNEACVDFGDALLSDAASE